MTQQSSLNPSQPPRRRKRRYPARAHHARGVPQANQKPTNQKPREERRREQEHDHNLVAKLGLRSGQMICLINPPQGAYSRFSNELPPGSQMYLGLPPRGPAHMFVLWPDTAQSLEGSLSYIKTMLDQDGTIWVMLKRKRAIRNEDDEAATAQDVKQAATKVGLVEGKQISISNSQYAIRLGFPGSDRRGRNGR